MPRHQTVMKKKEGIEYNNRVTLINHTLVENLLYAKPSGAVHLIGNLAPA